MYNVNVLYMNIQREPFNNPIFRKAITLSINKSFLEEFAYYRIGWQFNQTGVIPPQQSEWLDPSLEFPINAFHYDPQKAQELLASIGYKKMLQMILSDRIAKNFLLLIFQLVLDGLIT